MREIINSGGGERVNAFGEILRKQRKRKGYTQAELAEKIGVGDKTISKWETGRSLPDMLAVQTLAEVFGLSLAELMGGTKVENRNAAGNMQKCRWYVCPICGNILCAQGESVISCCGLMLSTLQAKDCEETHWIQSEEIDGEWYLTIQHEMSKEHFISFVALVGGDRVQIVKLYPEQEAEAHFMMRGHGVAYIYCNQHGLYRQLLKKQPRNCTRNRLP